MKGRFFPISALLLLLVSGCVLSGCATTGGDDIGHNDADTVRPIDETLDPPMRSSGTPSWVPTRQPGEHGSWQWGR